MGEESERTNTKVGIVATVSKKPRHRKKQLYQGLKKQMEFYFSDVNISKDRFMNQLMQQSSYVDLSVFMAFNRIKGMTSKIKDIANALQTSELLKVSECGTKVCRTTPPQEKQNSDDCTIYVEQLPSEADHNWLIEVFQTYGPIDYVSIPKFKHSRKNKGFAFVEFNDPQSAKTALNAFSDMGSCLSKQMDPENLFSIKTFEENENVVEKIEESSKREQSDKNNVVPITKEENEINKNDSELEVPVDSKTKVSVSRKRRKSSSKSDDSTIDSKKKLLDDSKLDEASPEKKLENSEAEMTNKRKNKRKISECSTGSKSDDSTIDSKKKLLEDSKLDEASPPEKKLENSEAEMTNKRKTKRKISECSTGSQVDGVVVNKLPKMEKGDEDKNNANACAEDDLEKSLVEDNVGASETLCAENVGEDTEEYLNDDDRRKKTRKRRKKHKRNKTGDNTHDLQILSKADWKTLRNRYLNKQKLKMKQVKQYVRQHTYNRYQDVKLEPKEELTVSNRLTLKPGVIVKVVTHEPIANKTFKNEAKKFSDVKYIDIIDSNMAYVRFDTATAAEHCVQSGHWANSSIISGSEEQEYWDKLVIKRDEKLNRDRTSKRGKDKLLKKAEEMHVKHIWFE